MIYPLIVLPISVQLYTALVGLLALLTGSGWTWFLAGSQSVALRYLMVSASAIMVAWFALALGYRVEFVGETVYCFSRSA